MRKYPYLTDSTFLFNFFKQKNLEHFVKVTILNFNEKPLKEIQGRVLSGSLNLDGNSSVRRTGNLSMYVEDKNASYMEIGGAFSLNKKIKIEVGLTNKTTDYLEYPIIWFPMGLYVIMDLSISRSTSGTNVSLQLKDKMVFLNGECGGTLPAAVTFSEYEELNPETGEYVIKQPTLIEIIKEAVNHFGGEQLGKIIISDLDPRIKKVMKWTKNVPLYHHQKENTHIYSLQNKGPSGYDQAGVFAAGDDVGFVNVDFYYPGELIGDAGNSVCDILDQIKNTLGNFEYFYDLDGNFIFQEIKNYLNKTPQVKDFNNLTEVEKNILDNYTIRPQKGKALYSFDSCQDLITSYSNSPQYSQIKNDFIVWGIRESATGQTMPIRYHLAIDEKPKTGNSYYCYWIEGQDKLVKAKVPIPFASGKQFPAIGEIEFLYKAEDTGKIYLWDSTTPYRYAATSEKDTKCEVPFDRVEKIQNADESYTYWFISYYHYQPTRAEMVKEIQQQLAASKAEYEKLSATDKTTHKEKYEANWKAFNDQINKVKTSPVTGSELIEVRTTDWRTELYLSGATTTRFGVNSNFYYTELANEWPKIYTLTQVEDANGHVYFTDKMKDEVVNFPDTLDYYLDFIDSGAAISEFSVSNIGRRSKIVNDDKVNCIFEKPIEDVILIPTGRDQETADLVQEAFDKGQAYALIDASIYNGLAGGGSQNSAYNAVRDLLYQYTNYNESISIQMLPLYFLEPHVRIAVKDSESGIYGDYIINSISMPLDVNGTMSLSCSKALERI